MCRVFSMVEWGGRVERYRIIEPEGAWCGVKGDRDPQNSERAATERGMPALEGDLAKVFPRMELQCNRSGQ
jgi:hypothetical protein